MSFSWLTLRISEEKERRQRETQILECLPHALEELHGALAPCVADYAAAFGPEAAEIQRQGPRIRITVREQQEGRWEPRPKVEIAIIPSLPGFRVDRAGTVLDIEIGILSGRNTYYKDGDQYLTVEELTRRILDQALFPKLGE